MNSNQRWWTGTVNGQWGSSEIEHVGDSIGCYAHSHASACVVVDIIWACLCSTTLIISVHKPLKVMQTQAAHEVWPYEMALRNILNESLLKLVTNYHLPIYTPVLVPLAFSIGSPAFSKVLYVHSRRSLCWGSICSTSVSVIPKNLWSNSLNLGTVNK